MNELAAQKTCFEGILSDVAAKPLELFLRANQMIKAVLFPKASLAAEQAVDFHGRVMFPRFALGQHRFVITKGC